MAVTNIYGNGKTTATAGANTQTHFYNRAGINSANKVVTYVQFADREQTPQHYGRTFKISKFEHIYDREMSHKDFAAKGYLTARTADDVSKALQSASLSEGSGPANQRKIHKVTYETTLARYGEMIDYTDEAILFSEDYIQTRYREELGELANMRYEDLIQQDMLSTPTVMYAGAATSLGTVADPVSFDLIRRATRKLARNRALKNTHILEGSTRVGTKPIAASYFAITDADVISDLETLTRGTVAKNGKTEYVYRQVHEYGTAKDVANKEVGAVHDTRFILAESAVIEEGKGASAVASSSLAATGGKYDVHNILYPTKGSFATVTLKGVNKVIFHSKAPSDVDGTNPYGTKGFFSYNFFYAGIILKPEALLKVQVAVKA